jgi:hypothetical protein
VYVKYSQVSPSFDAKDNELGGKLKRKLRDWRKQGRSWQWIAQRLSESGMYVPKSTAMNWGKAMGIE